MSLVCLAQKNGLGPTFPKPTTCRRFFLLAPEPTTSRRLGKRTAARIPRPTHPSATAFPVGAVCRHSRAPDRRLDKRQIRVAPRAEEIEVRSFVGLQHVIDVEPRVAADVRGRRRLPGLAATLE